MNYQQVLTFWFEEMGSSKWWIKDDDIDQLIADRFAELHIAAHHGELYEWRKTAKGRLAEVIVLDQFSRNMFRDSACAFAFDSMALALSQEAVFRGADSELTAIERSFLYMPFMHSESLKIHEKALSLYTQNGIQSNLDFEIKHKKIIEKFGRYPHRNAILNRHSSDEEITFLKQPGSSF